MYIYDNPNSQGIMNDLYVSQTNIQKSLQRLGSGLRINSAADDAAGLQISNTMGNEISGVRMGTQNIDNATNLINSAEGALSPIQDMLTRVRSLAVEGSADTLSTDNRSAIQSEVNQLVSQINDLANTANFNGVHLLDGSITHGVFAKNSSATVTQNVSLTSGANLLTGISYTTSSVTMDETISVQLVTDSSANSVDMVVQQIWTNGTTTSTTLTNVTSGYAYAMGGVSFSIGTISTSDIGQAPAYIFANAAISAVTTNNSLSIQVGADQGQTMTLGVADMRASALRISSLDLSTSDKAQHVIHVIDQAYAYVNTERGNLGAIANRLGYARSYEQSFSTNLQASQASIRDADMSAEMSSLTRWQIIQQAGTSALAQANQAPQSVLSLIR